MMKLKRSGVPPRDEPTESDIKHALANIMDNCGSFVVLRREDSSIQTTGTSPNDLLVEYNPDDGPIYRSANHSLSWQFVANVFIPYARRDSEWKELIEWLETDL